MSEKSENLANKAVNLFKEGLYCSEAILKVFNEYLNLGLNDAGIKMSTAFGAGLGASKCCCGSLTGAVMVISSLKGRTEASSDVDEVFRLTSELHDRFKQEFKSTCCRVLTKELEWGLPEHHKHCEQYVRGAVEILTDILEKRG